jgi:hypothetical protein
VWMAAINPLADYLDLWLLISPIGASDPERTFEI